MDPFIFHLVLPWLLLGFCCWLGYHLVRQNGRILLRLEALEERLGAPERAPAARQSLPAGSAAPEFELPDLHGTPHALSSFRGRPVLLIFFNPACGFCARMAPELAALSIPPESGRPLPVVISAGDPEQVRKLVETRSLRHLILVDPEGEVAVRYGAPGTPMGYPIDPDGRIAGRLAVGADALLKLAAGETSPEPARNGSGAAPAVCSRDLTRSRIERNGLAPGTPAPPFRLPCLEGGELSLEDFRRRKVLLVFSDPQCGPCAKLMPDLERLHRESLDLQLLMVSRGELDENRRKAREHLLTFPIVLQKKWEVSKQYAMFATPIAYLIDEEGAIAAPVAVGLEPILALAREARCGSARRDEAAVPV